MHSTLYTPHSTLHTLHFTLCTPHIAHYTLDFTLYTPHPTLYISHSTPYTLHFTLHTPHFTLYTLHFTLHTLHFKLHILHSALYSLHFTLHTFHFTVYTLHFAPTLYTLHSTFHTLHFALHTLHSTLYTPHSTLHTFRTLYTTQSRLHSIHIHSPLNTTLSSHPTLCTSHSSAFHMSTVHWYGNKGKMYKTVQITFHKSVLRDCIRVRGLHLVLITSLSLERAFCNILDVQKGNASFEHIFNPCWGSVVLLGSHLWIEVFFYVVLLQSALNIAIGSCD